MPMVRWLFFPARVEVARAHGLVKAREQAHAIDVEALAGIREGHPPGAADEERKAQFVLQ